MRHARADYNRIQDPAGHPTLWRALEILAETPDNGDEQLRGAIADVLEFFKPYTDGEEYGTPVADDEPVFLIRAQDRNAPDAVRQWAFIAKQNKASADIVSAAADWSGEMERWQRDHPERVKIPDVDEDVGLFRSGR